MKLIGIVGRAYYNRESQHMFQTRNELVKYLNTRDDVVCVTLLPTESEDYVELEVGSDKVNSKIDYILDKCDGFIVPGGTYAYHFDEYVINYAISHDKPLLAICLGFQVMCSMFATNRDRFDMTEKVDLEHHLGPGTEYQHDVLIEKDTKLMEIINKETIPVNSVHHDIVNFSFDKLKINAYSDDGVIEGVEYPNKKFIIGIQWHPEYIYDDNSKRILDSFLK